jgi:hypothetical protein
MTLTELFLLKMHSLYTQAYVCTGGILKSDILFLLLDIAEMLKLNLPR